MSYFVSNCYLFIIKLWLVDYLGWGRHSYFFSYRFTCNYVVSIRRGFIFLLVLGMCYVILLFNSLAL